MLNISRILFPVDFSERCLEAASYVGWIARKFGAQITLLHGMHTVEAGPISSRLQTELRKPYVDLIRIDEAALSDFADRALCGVPVTCVVEVGDAAEVITCYAKRNAVDLIVLPTQGLGEFRWLLLGSVTAKVLNDTPCPVWTTVHGEKVHPAEGEIAAIVCGVDIYSDPARIIEAASDMAAAFGGVVRLVHAIGAPEAKSERQLDAGLKRFLLETAREEIEKFQRQVGTKWEVCVQGGTVASVLRDAALHCQADLVVIGRGHLHNHFGRFRTHVGAIVRESPCPVLSL